MKQCDVRISVESPPRWTLAQLRLSFHIKVTFLSYFSLTVPQLSRNFLLSSLPHSSPRQVESLRYYCVLYRTAPYVRTGVHAHVHSLRRSPRRNAASPDHTLIVEQHERCLDVVAEAMHLLLTKHTLRRVRRACASEAG